MKVKISNLIGPHLDWAVAKCWWHDEFDRKRIFLYHSGFEWAKHTVRVANQDTCTRDLSFEWEPSTNWAQGGPILTREHISRTIDHSGLWIAYCTDGYTEGDEGKLHMHCDRDELVAGLRCYVSRRLGEYCDVPDELIGD